MSALTTDFAADSGHGWDELVRVWERTDAPEGWKVEIIEGIVTMTPPPAVNHNRTAAKLHRLLVSAIPQDWDVYQTQGLSVPARKGLFIPDLVVMPDSVPSESDNYLPCHEARLVVEITSKSNAHTDRIVKLRGYAEAGVPLYLLLDPWRSEPTATLYGKPEAGTYRLLEAVDYGDAIHLPDPFDLTIDTGVFPVS